MNNSKKAIATIMVGVAVVASAILTLTYESYSKVKDAPIKKEQKSIRPKVEPGLTESFGTDGNCKYLEELAKYSNISNLR